MVREDVMTHWTEKVYTSLSRLIGLAGVVGLAAAALGSADAVCLWTVDLDVSESQAREVVEGCARCEGLPCELTADPYEAQDGEHIGSLTGCWSTGSGVALRLEAL